MLKEHAKSLNADLARWTFLTGDRDEVDRFAARFGVSIARALNDPRDITHNLRTAIIDADGKLVKVYTGNEWSPEQVLADLEDPLAGRGLNRRRSDSDLHAPRERRLIARLRTPLAVQRYLNALPYNQEPRRPRHAAQLPRRRPPRVRALPRGGAVRRRRARAARLSAAASSASSRSTSSTT